MEGSAATPEMEALRRLPLKRRYVWRVASTLKWAFADSETENVEAERETLSPEDFAKVVDLVRLRPMQLPLFLTALLGPEEMQRMMIEAIGVAKEI